MYSKKPRLEGQERFNSDVSDESGDREAEVELLAVQIRSFRENN